MFAMHLGSDAKRTLRAFDRSMAIVQYSPDGVVLSANENFCQLSGYKAEEIVGKHHRMFVERDHAESAEYREVLGQAAARRSHRVRLQADRQGRQGGVDPRRLSPGDQRRRQGRQGRQHRQRHHRRQKRSDGEQRQDRRHLARPGDRRVRTRRRDPLRQRELPPPGRLRPRGDPGQAPQHAGRPGLREFAGIPGVLGEAEERRMRRRRVQAHRQGRPRSLDPGFLQSDLRPQQARDQGGQVRHRRHRPGRSGQPHRRRPQPAGARATCSSGSTPRSSPNSSSFASTSTRRSTRWRSR